MLKNRKRQKLKEQL